MPPIKGRMIGLQSRTGGIAQQTLEFRAVKNLSMRKKKLGFNNNNKHGKTTTVKNFEEDEKLQKLRIPREICKGLPSVKKFSASKAFIDIGDEESIASDDVRSESSGSILGVRKGRGHQNKYQIKLVAEKKFAGMVWDVACSPSGDFVVSCGDGIFLCDEELEKQTILANISLAGGIDFLSDNKIVAICRFADTVNIYTPEGNFLRGFNGGSSPMTVAVNSSDDIIIADTGDKKIHMYRPDGSLIRTISPMGTGYTLQWPLYLGILKNKNDVLVVSDCHQQKVLTFDSKGRFLRKLQLKTACGNEVLRPHGLCTTQDGDLLVVDNSIDSVEVFKHGGSTYLQTLMTSNEGATMRPKVVNCSADGQFFILGGLKGHVRLYEMLDPSEVRVKPEVKHEIIDCVKTENTFVKEESDVIVLD